jgi:hypothetical protein
MRFRTNWAAVRVAAFSAGGCGPRQPVEPPPVALDKHTDGNHFDPKNALAELAGNEFKSWTISRPELPGGQQVPPAGDR